MSRSGRAWILAVLLVAPSFAAAQDLGPRSWGLRAGAASDPDQVLFGVHVDLGEIVTALRLQPSLEVGVGDDVVTLQGLVPVHYRFETGGAWTPYVGGGVLLALIELDDDRSRGRDGDDGFDIAPVAVGGVEGALAGRAVLFELQLGGGHAFDAKVIVGWSF